MNKKLLLSATLLLWAHAANGATPPCWLGGKLTNNPTPTKGLFTPAPKTGWFKRVLTTTLTNANPTNSANYAAPIYATLVTLGAIYNHHSKVEKKWQEQLDAAKFSIPRAALAGFATVGVVKTLQFVGDCLSK